MCISYLCLNLDPWNIAKLSINNNYLDSTFKYPPISNAQNRDSDNDSSDLNTSFDDNEYFHMNMARINHTLSKMDLEAKIKNIRTQFITFASNIKQWDKTFAQEIEQIRHEVKSINIQIGNEKQSKMVNDAQNANQYIISSNGKF